VPTITRHINTLSPPSISSATLSHFFLLFLNIRFSWILPFAFLNVFGDFFGCLSLAVVWNRVYEFMKFYDTMTCGKCTFRIWTLDMCRQVRLVLNFVVKSFLAGVATVRDIFDHTVGIHFRGTVCFFRLLFFRLGLGFR
jgi:hypothetical protein